MSGREALYRQKQQSSKQKRFSKNFEKKISDMRTNSTLWTTRTKLPNSRTLTYEN